MLGVRYPVGTEVVIVPEQAIGTKYRYTDPKERYFDLGCGDEPFDTTESIITSPHAEYLQEGTKGQVVEVGKVTRRVGKSRTSPSGFRDYRLYRVETPEGTFWVSPDSLRTIKEGLRVIRGRQSVGSLPEVEAKVLPKRRIREEYIERKRAHKSEDPDRIAESFVDLEDFLKFPDRDARIEETPGATFELTNAQTSKLFRLLRDVENYRSSQSVAFGNIDPHRVRALGGDTYSRDTYPLTNAMRRFLKKIGAWGLGYLESRDPSCFTSFTIDYSNGTITEMSV